MIDIASITTGFSLMNSSLGAVKHALEAAIKAGAAKDVVEALRRVEEVYSQLFDLNGKLLILQQENESLRKELQAKDDWEKRKAQYDLTRTEGGAMVWSSKEEPKHYACPNCLESKKEIHILQDANDAYTGHFECKQCKNDYQIRREKSLPKQSSGYNAFT